MQSDTNDITYCKQKRAKKKKLTSWEFVLSLLCDHKYESIIQWTHDYEFKFTEVDKVAGLWGIHNNQINMSSDRLFRSLHYYGSRYGIVEKIHSEHDELVYRIEPKYVWSYILTCDS